MRWTLGLGCGLLLLLGPVSPAAGIGSIGEGEINSSEEPGSVLVFHKLITGTLAPTLPARTFEISVICPASQICATGEGVRLHRQWVCPADPTDPQQRCPRPNFDLHPAGGAIPVFGTVRFNPANVGPRTRDVFAPPCPRGYLIVWVVDDAGNPIKFDGLISDAVIRGSNGSAGAYDAYPVQAVSTVAHKAIIEPVDPVTGDVTLTFDGRTENRAITGTVFGTVRYEKLTAPRVDTVFPLLTIDTRAGRPSHTTIVDFRFYKDSGQLRLSLSTAFVCWTEQRLLDLDPIGRSLVTGPDMRKGLVRSVKAEKVITPVAGDLGDKVGPVTLIGIIETKEHNASGAIVREYAYSFFHDGVTIPTASEP